MNRTHLLRFCVSVLLGAGVAQATTKTWSGAGDWFADTGNWSPSPPVTGDSVEVAAGSSLTLTNSPPALAALTQLGGTLTFTGWDTVLTAATVTVSGTLTHPAQSATSTNALGVWVPDNRIQIACETFTLSGAGKINVTLKGYISQADQHGYGPGGGMTGTGPRASGAGHGGTGGRGGVSHQLVGGNVYGSLTEPVDPGSGAGGSSGFPGGGAVRIEATGAVTIDGDILADAGGGTGWNNGGGSGGSVWIVCETLAGSGTISARGGAGGDQGGSGGGGRIAIDYDAAAQAALDPAPAVTLTAVNGSGAGHSTWNGIRAEHRIGNPGTVHLPDRALLRPILNLGGALHFADHAADWTTPSLMLTGVVPRFPDDFALTVEGDLTATAGGGLVMVNQTGLNGRLAIDGNASFTGGRIQYHFATNAPATASIGGDLALSAGAQAHFFAAATNGVNGFPYGGLLSVGGTVTLSGSSTRFFPFSNPTNSGSLKMRVGAFDLQAGAIVDANETGCRGGIGNGGEPRGHGVGGGRHANSRGGGGGYGGKGGDSTSVGLGSGGPAYGDDDLPMHPGSGAGGGTTQGSLRPNPAGGLVWIVADGHIQIDGTIRANAGANAHGSGGSSGGGVLLVGTSFDMGAGALITANGHLAETWAGGGGGGGRVAVLTLNVEGYRDLRNGNLKVVKRSATPPAYADKIMVNGATGQNPGGNGTIVFGDQVYRQGSMIILR